MKKLVIGFLVFAVLLSLSGCSALPISFPKIDRHPPAANYAWGKMTALPTYDPNSTNAWQMDLRSRDLSGLDLRQSLDDLTYAHFDTGTVWPSAGSMPADFDWPTILDLGKNPGLGVRSLQAQGIDGKGVGIAIIDQPLIVDHQEYGSRMQLYEEIGVLPTTESQMHGPAVASIAAGDTVGVAPEADLYYIGAWTGDWAMDGSGAFTPNFLYYAQAVRRVLQINQQLSAGHKIRVIAMQTGWSPGQTGYNEITAAVLDAKNAGLLVVSSNLEQTFGFKFQGLGRAPMADPDRFESYEPGLFWAKDFYAGNQPTDQLLVPMDSRTTAGPTGASEYVFYRQGGWSWAIPYIAGVYALAAQVKPSITPAEFWASALKTGRTIQLNHAGQTIPFGPIVDPVALVAALKTP